MKITRFAFKVHRYLSYLMFAQLLMWILGGAIFAIVPFDDVTKSGAVVSKPVSSLPNGWQAQLARVNMNDASQISSYTSAAGPALKIKGKDETLHILASSGEPVPAANVDSVRGFAQSIYKGEGKISEVKMISQSETRLGIVDELYGQTGVWQVSFDDHYGTRLYFDGKSGEYLKARNDYWVVFDLFWRLHVMDYSEGEDFNNWLLRIASVLAVLFTLSGMVLTWNAARRELSRSTRQPQTEAINTAKAASAKA